MFSNVKPGDVVHYLTPQGQNGKGKVVLRYDTHVVVNRGKGQPQVVNDKNYVKHERGGKVVGALLSRVAQYDKNRKTTETQRDVDRINSKKHNQQEAAKMSDDFLMVDMSKLKAAKATDAKRRAIKKAARNYADARRVAKGLRKEEFGCHDAGPGCHATGDENKKKLKDYIKPKYVNAGRRATKAAAQKAWAAGKARRLQGESIATRLAKPATKAEKAAMKTPEDRASFEFKRKQFAKRAAVEYLGKKKHGVSEARNPAGPYGGHPYDWDPTLRKQIMAVAAKKVKKLPGSPQPSKLDTGDTYKPAYKGPPPRRGTTSEDSRDVEAARQRITKTKNSIKKKKKKLIKEISDRLVKRYTIAAVKDVTHSEKEAEGARTKSYADAMYDKAVRRSNKITKNPRAMAAYRKHVYGKNIYAEGVVNEVSAPGKEDWIKANKARFIERYGKEKGIKVLYAKAWKMKNEARENEYTANLQMAGSSRPKQKGHYLMRDGRKLSGPHSPEEAVKAYKALDTAGKGDSKGVKIVHVKEAKSIWSDHDRNKMDANHKKNKAIVVAHHKKMLEKGYKYTHSDGRNTPFDGYDTEHHYTSANGKHKKIMSYSAYALGYDAKLKPEYRKEKLSTNHPDLREATELHVDLMEASEQKVKELAQKAIKLAKDRKKGGKTANTEPELKMPQGGNSSPSPIEHNGVSSDAKI